MIRVVFMGSPDFAIPSLQALITAEDIKVVGVVTQPDRPAGRGGKLKMQPVKEKALEHDLPVYQPQKLRGEEATAQLAEWNPDVHVVAAFGQILKPEVLYLPPHDSINVHASILPRWRGAAPIQAAIREGDQESGVTIMKMDEGLDTGDILHIARVPIAPRETSQSLHDKLAELGGGVLPDTLRRYINGEITPQPQADEHATYAPQIKKEDGEIDWTQSAQEIDAHIRAFTPWPSAFTYWNETLLKILQGEPISGGLPAGQVARGTDQHPLIIGTGEGIYAAHRLQLAGKKRLDAADFLNGNHDIIGAQLH